ncbi:MAG TPA: alginate lyase [Clostridium sp.]|uniref:alginate lyase n=1 Tax=Clostridium sp. TaxID=1506 RepID=UPI002F94D43B
MFITQPNNFNQVPMWNGVPMFSGYPMMPRFSMGDDPRQKPMPQTPATTKPPTSAATKPLTSTVKPQVTNGSPTAPGTNQDPEMSPKMAAGTPIINDPLYNQGWLKTQIGKYIKIEFLIGSNIFIDREGVLQEVGISYIVIKESGTNDLVMCDIYSIKFVRVFDNQSDKCRG